MQPLKSDRTPPSSEHSLLEKINANQQEDQKEHGQDNEDDGNDFCNGCRTACHPSEAKHTRDDRDDNRRDKYFYQVCLLGMGV